MKGDLNCVGVDGTKSGWIAVWRDADRLTHRIFADARALLDAHRDAHTIAVDIPIGLPDSGRRRADEEARKFVGGHRASSVFSSPVRGILGATSQPEASRLHREIDGRGFGAQSFAILPKIREWDELLQSDKRACAIVREIHPEVSFAALKGGAGNGLYASKRSAEGAAIRLELLARAFGAGQIEALMQAVPRRQASADDVLDALVALWSAERIATKQGRTLPSPPDFDGTGLASAIWY